MPEIHPSVIISDETELELADDVKIGPYCVIGGKGKITIGPGTRIRAHVVLEAPLTIGSGNDIYHHAVIGTAPQDLSYDPDHPGAGLVIGDNNVFREGFSVHRATSKGHDTDGLDPAPAPTRIGDNNYCMAYAHIGHDAQVGSNITLANNTMVAGHVEIGDHVICGGGSGIHQFVRIGRFAMISGNGGGTQDFPPFMVAHDLRVTGSINVVGLRRAGLREHIGPIKQAFRLLYRSGLTNTAFVKAAEKDPVLRDDPLCAELIEFVRTTKRGITPYRPHGKFFDPLRRSSAALDPPDPSEQADARIDPEPDVGTEEPTRPDTKTKTRPETDVA